MKLDEKQKTADPDQLCDNLSLDGLNFMFIVSVNVSQQEQIKSSTLICLVVWLNTHTHTIFTKHVTFIDENIYYDTPLLPAYST